MTVTREDQFSLEFACEPDFISTARLFAGAAARYYGCDEDVVQDVKIAVSEACTNAVKAHADALISAPIRVLVREVGPNGEGGTTVRFSVPRGNPEPA